MPIENYTLTRAGVWQADGTANVVSQRTGLVPGTYKPSITTTGVIAGVNRTTWVGDYKSLGSNTVIENMDITGKLSIQANHTNVIVRNCWIKGGTADHSSTVYNIVNVTSSGRSAGPTLIQDCTIAYNTPADVIGMQGAAGKDAVFERCNVYNCYDGIDFAGGNMQVLGSWIHDNSIIDPTTIGTHEDAIQINGGPGTYVIKGNLFECKPGQNTGVIINTDTGVSVDGVTIDKNWFIATAGTINCGAGFNTGDDDISNLTITNNVFSARSTWKTAPALIRATARAVGFTYSGNTFEDGTVCNYTNG